MLYASKIRAAVFSWAAFCVKYTLYFRLLHDNCFHSHLVRCSYAYMHAWIDEMGISLYRILVTQHMSKRGGERDVGTDWMNCKYGPAKPKISMLLPFEGTRESNWMHMFSFCRSFTSDLTQCEVFCPVLCASVCVALFSTRLNKQNVFDQQNWLHADLKIDTRSKWM